MMKRKIGVRDASHKSFLFVQWQPEPKKITSHGPGLNHSTGFALANLGNFLRLPLCLLE
jgi:hypothetical protein